MKNMSNQITKHLIHGPIVINNTSSRNQSADCIPIDAIHICLLNPHVNHIPMQSSLSIALLLIPNISILLFTYQYISIIHANNSVFISQLTHTARYSIHPALSSCDNLCVTICPFLSLVQYSCQHPVTTSHSHYQFDSHSLCLINRKRERG